MPKRLSTTHTQKGAATARTSTRAAGSLFLSYARADDEPFVAAVRQQLVDRGMRAWFDRADMPSRALTFLQEIRNAIAAADRLVLVVGPAALRSDYVRAEWQYALALSKPVVAVLRLGEFEHLPRELGRVHSIDGRESRPAAAVLDELLRVLRDPLPKLGSFLTPVPALPPYYQPRTADFLRLSALVLGDQDEPETATGFKRVAVIRGMPGMGKSVLAAAFARSTETRRAFADGVLWLSAQRSSGDELATSQDAAPSLLVVVDDASDLGQIEPILNRLGARARLLVTTRDARLSRAMGARELALEPLATDATLRQLADAAGAAVDALPNAAHEVAKWGGGLPFATSICGAMVRGGRPWEDVLDALKHADMVLLDDAVLNYTHGSVLACLAVAVAGLTEQELDPLMDLRVLPRGVAVPEALVLRFWGARRGLAASKARGILARLAERSLLRWDGAPRMVLVHSLVHDYLRARARDASPLHQAMVDMYTALCPNGWAAGPNDGYFFEWFVHHLAGAGDADAVATLLFDPLWMQAKLRATSVYALANDYSGGLTADPDAERELRAAILRTAPALEEAPDHLAALLSVRLLEAQRPATTTLAERLLASIPRPRFRLVSRSLTDLAAALVVSARMPVHGELCAVALLPGGERFLMASRNGALHLHEIATGRAIDTFDGHGNVVAACALADGRHAAMISRLDDDRGTVLELVDLLQRVRHTVGRSEAREFICLCALGDGTLITGDEDGELNSWDVDRRVRLRTWREPGDHSSESTIVGGPRRTIDRLLALPGGRRIASVLSERWLSVWDADRGALVWSASVESGIRGIAWAGDGIAIASANGRVEIRDPESGASIRDYSFEIPGLITAFAVHPRSMTAIFATEIASWRFIFGRAELYVAAIAGDGSKPVRCGTHDIRVETMAAHDEPPLLVSGSLDGTVRVWDLQRAAAQEEHPRHWDRVTTLARFDGDRQLLTSSYDGTLKIWRMADGSVSRTIDPQANERVTSAALLNRSRVVYALANGTVEVLDLKTGRESWSKQVHRYGMGVVAAVRDMRAFVTGDRYGWVKVWSERRREWTDRLLGTPGDVVDGIVVAASGQRVLAWDCGDDLCVYDLEKSVDDDHDGDDDDDEEAFWRLRFAGTNEAVILLPGNRFAFPIVEDDRHAVVGCSLDTLKPFVRLAVPKPVTALAADAHGARVAIGLQDGSIDVRALRGKGSPSRLLGHAARIEALRFVDDLLLVSAAGSTLRLWDVARGVTLAVFGADGPLHRVSVGAPPACVIATELSGRVHFLEITDRPPPMAGARRQARPRSPKPAASRRR